MQQGYFTLANDYGTMFLDVRNRGEGRYFVMIHGKYNHYEMRELLEVDHSDDELDEILREGILITEKQLFQILKNDPGVRRHINPGD